MQRVRTAVVAFNVEAKAFREVRKLSHEIAPFAHLRIREVCLWRKFPQLRLRKLFRLLVPPFPELQRAEEVRPRDAELGVRLVRLLLLVDGAAPRVVAAHCRDNRERRRKRGELRRREQHPRKARLYRDPREFAACRGKRDVVVRVVAYRAEFEKFP